ncbi:MAG: hypothetical protein WCB19_07320 [Thermoplasmata archaeon]
MNAVKFVRRANANATALSSLDEEGQERVTLLLGADTIEKLKEMGVAGRYRGLGRTIDALVDAVSDSRSNVDGLIRAAVATGLVQNIRVPNKEQLQVQLMLAFSVNSAVLAERLNKFIGLNPEQIAEEVKRTLPAPEAKGADRKQ